MWVKIYYFDEHVFQLSSSRNFLFFMGHVYSHKDTLRCIDEVRSTDLLCVIGNLHHDMTYLIEVRLIQDFGFAFGFS